jgi:hypothetical protein
MEGMREAVSDADLLKMKAFQGGVTTPRRQAGRSYPCRQPASLNRKFLPDKSKG